MDKCLDYNYSSSIRPEFIDNYFLNKYEIDIFYILSVISIITLVILYYFSLIKINILEKKLIPY